jgi:hypothetical protein
MLEELRDDIAGLLARAGLPTEFAAAQMFGGNNRVYRLTCRERDVVLKVYFHGPGDRRPRLAREFGFLNFAWSHGLRNLPEPLAQDPVHNIGLYGYVAGRKLNPGEAEERHVAAALDFVIVLDRLKGKKGSQALPEASEAGFSLGAHLDVVEARIARLAGIEPGFFVQEEARTFASGPLRERWEAVKAAVSIGARREGIALDAKLRLEDRCISPSDFGFHNALLADTGELAFIDFEYAGWDDPAKLVGDFFNQVAVPVPREHYASFADRVAGLFADSALQRRRFDLVLPIYQVKWICIVLNDFLPAGNSRRTFSGDDNAEQRKTRKLGLARELLRRIEVAD